MTNLIPFCGGSNVPNILSKKPRVSRSNRALRLGQLLSRTQSISRSYICLVKFFVSSLAVSTVSRQVGPIGTPENTRPQWQGLQQIQDHLTNSATDSEEISVATEEHGGVASNFVTVLVRVLPGRAVSGTARLTVLQLGCSISPGGLPGSGGGAGPHRSRR